MHCALFFRIMLPRCGFKIPEGRCTAVQAVATGRSGMDIRIYRELLRLRADIDDSVAGDDRNAPVPLSTALANFCCCVKGHYDEAESRMRADFAGLKVVWHNELRSDWMCFMRNSHPVVACCKSHELHPVARRERWLINIMLVMLAVHLSVAATEAQQCIAYDLHTCGDMWRNQTQQPRHQGEPWWAKGNVAPPKGVCCGLNRFGVVWSVEEGGNTGLSIYMAVVTIGLAQLWFQCAACGLAQKWEESHRVRGERCGHAVIGVSAAMLGLGLMPLLHYMAACGLLLDLLINFILVKLAAILAATLFLSAVFLALWCLERHWKDWDASFYVRWSDKDTQEVAWEVCRVDLLGALGSSSVDVDGQGRFDLLEFDGEITPRNSPKATKGLLSSPSSRDGSHSREPVL